MIITCRNTAVDIELNVIHLQKGYCLAPMSVPVIKCKSAILLKKVCGFCVFSFWQKLHDFYLWPQTVEFDAIFSCRVGL
jgi:hypothetical protein